jgi:hypothetical protein
MKIPKLLILMVISFGMASCKKDSSKSSSTTSSSTTTSTATNTGLGTADSTGCPTSTGASKVTCLAQAFLATLTTTQQTSVELSLTLANAKNWSNLPISLAPRNGIQFSTLTSTQLSAALAIIKATAGTGYSMEGFEKFQTIRAADDYLGSMQSGYGDGNYFIAFLGTPTNTGKWMLQYGGHHYAANIMFNAGAMVEITPLHEGVEPHTGFTINNVTYTNPLTNDVTGMQNMLGSFTSDELSTAKISGTFSDCLMIPGSTTNTMPTVKQGIKVSALSTTAQAKVLAAMQPWINDIDSTQAATIRAAYKSELADTYVCYASNTSAVAGTGTSFLTAATDYVRIDGPTIWIEFCCQSGIVIQNQIHYHTVMRDHSRDYLGL